MARGNVYKRIYRRNPSNMGGLSNNGPKTEDQWTGFWTYRDYTTINEWGDRVDVRGPGMGFREGGPTPPENSDYTTTYLYTQFVQQPRS